MKIIGVSECSQRTGKTYSQTMWAIKNGKIQAEKIGVHDGWGGYRWGIPESEVERLLTEESAKKC